MALRCLKKASTQSPSLNSKWHSSSSPKLSPATTPKPTKPNTKALSKSTFSFNQTPRSPSHDQQARQIFHRNLQRIPQPVHSIVRAYLCSTQIISQRFPVIANIGTTQEALSGTGQSLCVQTVKVVFWQACADRKSEGDKGLAAQVRGTVLVREDQGEEEQGAGVDLLGHMSGVVETDRTVRAIKDRKATVTNGMQLVGRRPIPPSIRPDEPLPVSVGAILPPEPNVLENRPGVHNVQVAIGTGV